MKYRKIGNTNLELSEVTFGAWAIGGWIWGGLIAEYRIMNDELRSVCCQASTINNSKLIPSSSEPLKIALNQSLVFG